MSVIVSLFWAKPKWPYNTAAEEDKEEEDNDKNDDNNNDDKGVSALGLDRDLRFFAEQSEPKKLSKVKKTPEEQRALLIPR